MRLDGSDLHIKTDTGKAYYRIHGDLAIEDAVETYTDNDLLDALEGLIGKEPLERFEKDMELDFALELPGVARFRGNLFQQREHIQAVFRVIPFEIRTMEDLHLPESCYNFIHRPRGLVLVTGPAGSGKSTSLAAMVDRINREQHVHIVTVEDPIEYVHDDHVALINQRELHNDTLAFANALKYVLRQDPDVILVGEMRDLETIHLAITAAETGHLVFATLHTVDSVQTIDRVVDVFPMHQQQQIRMQLSVNLLGVISQTLVKRKDGRGRVAAFEVLNCTSAVRNQIRENKSYQIGSIIQTGARQGMQTLDQSLARLVDFELVDVDVAKQSAKDVGEFMRLIGASKGAPAAGSAAKPAPVSNAPGARPPVSTAPSARPAASGAPASPPPVASDAPAPPPVQDEAPSEAEEPASAVRGQPHRPGYRKK